MKHLFFILLFFILYLNLLSQSLTDTVININQVEVRAERILSEIAITKTNIDSLILLESMSVSLASLLSDHSPVFIKTYGQGSMATASFRGTAASHTQVEWNGMNINSPMLGQVDFSLIPVTFIDELELYHGGGSLQNGSGALGGSVNINSKPQWDKKFYGSVFQEIASFSTYKTFITTGFGNKRIQLKTRFFHEEAKNDFDYYNNKILPFKDVKQKNANYDKNGVLTEVFFRPNHSNVLALNCWYQTADRNLPPIAVSYNKKEEQWQKDKELRIAGNWKHYRSKLQTELQSGYQQTSLNYFLKTNETGGDFLKFDSRSSIFSYSNKFKLKYKITEKTLLTAIINQAFHKVEIKNYKDDTGYDATRHESGLSLNMHHAFDNNFATYGLLRIDWVDKSFTPLLFAFGAEKAFFNKQSLILKTNISRNYHQPTLNDLYWLPGGNEDLKPEQAYTFDAGLDFILKKTNKLELKTNFTAYLSYIDDWIIWRPGKFRYWTAENIKEVFSRGIETSISAKKNLNNIVFNYRGHYAFTRTTNKKPTSNLDDSKDKQLIYIPIHQTGHLLGITYKKYNFTLKYTYTSRRYTSSSNDIDRINNLPAYGLVDLKLGKQFEIVKFKTDFLFGINNLLDSDYEAILNRPMPKRNYVFQFRVGF